MTTEVLPPSDVTLAQILQTVKVPMTQAGAFVLALSYTCEQYGFTNLALALRDAAIDTVQPVA